MASVECRASFDSFMRILLRNWKECEREKEQKLTTTTKKRVKKLVLRNSGRDFNKRWWRRKNVKYKSECRCRDNEKRKWFPLFAARFSVSMNAQLGFYVTTSPTHKCMPAAVCADDTIFSETVFLLLLLLVVVLHFCHSQFIITLQMNYEIIAPKT